MAWPASNPSNNSNGGLLASLALKAGITNFSTLPWQAAVEVLLINILQNVPVNQAPSLNGLTVTALGAAQNSTPTAAQLFGGIVTQTSQTGGGTVTTPTGAVLSAACPVTPIAGSSFDCVFANLGDQTLTVTAGASGITIVGTAAIPTLKNALLRFVCTGTNTWLCYVVVSA